METTKSTLAELGVKVDIPILSALNFALALSIPIAVCFIMLVFYHKYK